MVLSRQQRSRSLIFACLCSFALLLFLVFSFLPSPSAPAKKGFTSTYSRITGKKAIKPPLDLVDYLDTTQVTNYTLLDQLFLQDNFEASQRASHELHFNRHGDTPAWIANRFKTYWDAPFRSSALDSGHALEQLVALSKETALPNRFLIQDGHLTYVDMIVILEFTNDPRFISQLNAIFAQTLIPQSVWIICNTEEDRDHLASTLQKQVLGDVSLAHIQLLVMKNTNDRRQWLTVAYGATSEYVWILDQGVVPGRNYLELVLGLLQTDTYRNTLLGPGFRFTAGEEAETLSCAEPIRDDTSQRVHVVFGTWILRREWLSQVFIQDHDTAPAGYWITRHAMQAGIAAMGLPMDSLWPDYIVDVGDSAKTSCEAIQATISDQKDSLFERLLILEQTLVKSMDSVAVIVDNPNSLNPAVVQLICAFQARQNSAVHLITTGGQHGLSASQARETIAAQDPQCAETSKHLYTHNLDLTHGQNPNVHTDDAASLTGQFVERVIPVLATIEPDLVIHMDDHEPTSEAIKAVHAFIDTTLIVMPVNDVTHVLWMADLPMATLKQWHAFTVQVTLMTDSDKPESFVRLYRSVERAHYLGDKVDITVFMEHTSDDDTIATAERFEWPHGTKDMRHRIVPAERTAMFVESWYPATNHEYAIIIDDGIELSPQYYSWVKYALLKYRYGGSEEPLPSHLYGISLYSPRLVDNTPTRELLHVPVANTPYLMQTPCSLGGALYFPEHWREFHDYITARIADHESYRLQHIHVPGAHSRLWTHSWRRYFDEVVYLRGYVMLYPQFDQSHSSLSTRHQLPGHTTQHHNNGEKENEDDTSILDTVMKLYRVPLLDSQQLWLHMLPEQRLPRLSELAVLDLWGKPATMDMISKRGFDFHATISACPPSGTEHDASDLLCPFAKLVPGLPPKAKLPTRTITLYLPSPTP